MFIFARSRIRSFGFAFQGVRHLLASQPNARLHALATAVVITGALWYRLSAGDWCWLIAAMASVWVAEALNTALELLADAACPEHHPLIGRAKDVAAGAVLLAAVGAAGVGVCIFLPRMGF